MVHFQVSTYARTLQHQIAGVPPLSGCSRALKKGCARAVKIICVCSIENADECGQPRRATALGLMARWAGTSDDGDLTGASFQLAGRSSRATADRRLPTGAANVSMLRANITVLC